MEKPFLPLALQFLALFPFCSSFPLPGALAHHAQIGVMRQQEQDG